MRYIRFLKTPRIVTDKGTTKSHVYCLITITSDLGDSFLPHHVELSAELTSPSDNNQVLVWRDVKWTAGMRTLPITLPITKSRASLPLQVRVGVEPSAAHDEYALLSEEDNRGVVSAWSAEFNTAESKEAKKLVERRFNVGDKTLCIWEETGESIARHLWDAGITISCNTATLLSPSGPFTDILSRRKPPSLRVLELGTGCGIVGITLASCHPGADVTLTDLPEAREIVEKNIASAQANLAPSSSVRFDELDWDHDLPISIMQPMENGTRGYDIVLAADCTYNADSSPALVNTLVRLAKLHPPVAVAIAMKMRHESEKVFFDLMANAGFRESETLEFELPGDVNVGEEVVYLHVYRRRNGRG